jgi:ABC-type dipeptide/oligopeptide/nickel transport system permease component
MRLARVVGRRLVFAVPTVFGIVTATFFITHVLPGNPAYSLAGPNPSPANVAAIERVYGFNLPLTTQYWHYLTKLAHLNLGLSTVTGSTVLSDLTNRLPATLELIVLSLTLALIIGVTAGTVSARRAGSAVDRAVRGGSSIMLAMPDFWLGLVLLYIFFFKLGWAPAPLGQISPADVPPTHITGAVLLDSILTLNGPALGAAAAHAVLPVVTLGSVLAAPITRLTRSATLEVLESDYVSFGRACGLPARTLRRYALRAALPPVVTFAGIAFTILLGGTVLIETVFSWGGAAQYAASAIQQQDFDAVQGFVLFAGVASIVIFLVVDLLYVALDPRVTL